MVNIARMKHYTRTTRTSIIRKLHIVDDAALNGIQGRSRKGTSALNNPAPRRGLSPTTLVVMEYDTVLQRSNFNVNHNHNHRSWSHLIIPCIFSRLIFLSCLLIVTYIICITQEFTYILNFHGYVTNTRWNHDPHIKLFGRKLRKLSVNNKKHFREKVMSNKQPNDWRYVADNIYSYSAYWDNRSHHEPVVRIIVGANIGNGTFDNLKCLLMYRNSELVEEVTATYRVLMEHHFEQSRATYVYCNVLRKEPPSKVSLLLSEWNSNSRSKIIWMEVGLLQGNSPSGLGVCVRPLFNYTDIFRIVEFIAYYEALGATHFTFYNYNSTENIGKLIRNLQDHSYSIELLSWKLPTEIQDMWSMGQIANINDCIYRNMARNAYIAVVDLDEFITPRHVMTIQDLITAHEKGGRRIGSFVLRSCVFCTEYKPDILPSKIPPFITQASVRRENWIYPFLVRTKYIVKPQEVIAAGVHHVWKLIPGAEERFIPASQALVHHYRAHLCPGNKKDIGKGEIDPMSRKYLNHLLRSKALDIWNQMNRITNDE
ncbi:glycosyltransferase family 92 protein [Nephila pilipes]|uniref:Glycosyltransferase family 92 protein n=1 Tax=Nephila pilipes TaxID=299642 RepID=A0A8X6TRZ0_NEPPI|nr:glycosyltransferase family 92 protein [Nephila pilipes]